MNLIKEIERFIKDFPTVLKYIVTEKEIIIYTCFSEIITMKLSIDEQGDFFQVNVHNWQKNADYSIDLDTVDAIAILTKHVFDFNYNAEVVDV